VEETIYVVEEDENEEETVRVCILRERSAVYSLANYLLARLSRSRKRCCL